MKNRSKGILESAGMGGAHENRETTTVSHYLQALRVNDMGILPKTLEPLVTELDRNLIQEYRN